MNERRAFRSVLLIAAITTMALAPARLPAAEDSSDDLVKAIVDLVGDKDKDMRALGLQQVREAAKGSAATRRFVALLPSLPPESQAALIDALADRGDRAARPAVLEMVKSPDDAARSAALRALGSLGETADVPLLVQLYASKSDSDKAAAGASLTRLPGDAISQAIAAELTPATPKNRAELIALLAARGAKVAAPDILAAALDADAGVREAAMSALGQLAGPEQVPGMVAGVLKAQPGAEREAAERAVMLVCDRIEDPTKRTVPLLAAFAKLSDDEQTAFLPTIGRVGGADALMVVETAIGDERPARRDAGMKALCNWPDASIAPRLLAVVQHSPNPDYRTRALLAVIRVAALKDQRTDAERLDLLKQAMELATRDDERNAVVKRCRAIRTVESLRFVVPYLDRPVYAEEACATVVELAHHRELRNPNLEEFNKALDNVIRICKDPDVLDRAHRFREGRT